MVPWAWDPQRWTEQMMYFGWLLMLIVSLGVAFLLLAAAGLRLLEWIKEEATSNLAPNQEPMVHVLHRQQRKSADV